MIWDLTFMATSLIAGILFLWFTSIASLEFRKMKLFLPFFFLGIIFSLGAGFSFFGVFDQVIWFGLELGGAFMFLWLFVLIRRKNEFG